MAKKKNKSRRRARRRMVTALVVVAFLLAGAAAVSGNLIQKPVIAQPTPVEPGNISAISDSTRKNGFYTVLLCGTDDGNGGSDTIMVAAVDTENKAIHILSVPRDTMVDEDWTVKKINSAYNRGGVEMVESEVEKTLGIPIDYSVSVNLQGFISLVDTLGGVDFDVPVDMDYDDPAQDLHIHFTAGVQHLDGQGAMEVVRFRHNNDGSGYTYQDLDRIETQHAFLSAVAQKLFSVTTVTKIPQLVSLFSDNVSSNMTRGNMIWFGKQALAIGRENIHFYTLPGEAKYVLGGSYYILDSEATLAMVNETVNPYKRDCTAEDLDIRCVD